MKKVLSVILISIFLFATVAFAGQSENVVENKDITKDLILENSAVYNEKDNSILLCPNQTWSSGKAKYPYEISEDFTISFEYKIGGGTSADGIVLAFFAEEDSITIDGGYMNFEGCGGYGLEFDTYRNSGDAPSAHIALIYDKVSNHLVSVEDSRVDDEKWHKAVLTIEGNTIDVSIDNECVINQKVAFKKTYRYMYFAASTGAATDNHYIRNVKFTGRAAYSNASNWAVPEMDKAEINDLIPNILKGKDMTKLITRQEFAALSVRLYESLAKKNAPVVSHPFEDTNDSEIAKAYGLGITKGVSETLFAPDKDISREEVATMLTRTLKAYIPNLNTKVTSSFKFADDDVISSWAKESVYFMVDKKINYGIGDNKFAPKNSTKDEEAILYANSTREQAILMALRAFEIMK